MRKTVAEALAELAQAEGVYELYLTDSEALAVLRLFEGSNAHTPATTRAMKRLAALLSRQAGLRDDRVPQPVHAASSGSRPEHALRT
ncbi:hypothetical protein ACFV90_36625 [Streptomyces sp. NPDC059904]|uniref:hypothetical protein n=1 Tax=Streptomyces sp. NPDC059904 TaxID=3346996 RepID=UPI003658C53C